MSEPKCPHRHISYRGGINWVWISYSSEKEAQEVLEWVFGGSNDKWGHARGTQAKEDGNGHHTLHLHRDNTRRPW